MAHTPSEIESVARERNCLADGKAMSDIDKGSYKTSSYISWSFWALLVAAFLVLYHFPWPSGFLLLSMGANLLRLAVSTVSTLAVASTAYGQSCNVTTLQDTPPGDGSHVALQSFSYCGGNLNATAYIHNDDYNKLVTIYYSNVQNFSTPLTSVGLGYVSSLDNGWELWNANTPVWVEGITQLLNITYLDTDAGVTYDQIVNLAVEASGDPIPTLPSPPSPYAAPQQFSDDITDFLAVSPGSQVDISLARMFLNINPAVEGAAQGIVVAGRSGPTFDSEDPDYEYDWVRDSSLTMDVVRQLYNASTNATASKQYEAVLFEYAAARVTEQNDPNLQTGLGEPKFYLNNTIFSGPWGRPQNDGPATAAITLIEFANAYLSKGGNADTVKQQIYNGPVLKDLLFVANNWSSPSFDLWEEEKSDHFYTRMVQARALGLGSGFARNMDDQATATNLYAQAKLVSQSLAQFWDEGRQILLYEYGPVLKDKSSYLDVSVVLGLIHGYVGVSNYSYTNERVESTVVRLATSFIQQYPIINQTHQDSSGATLGIAIGRYPEDVYTGTGTAANGGNPWYLCTAALAQYMWAASQEYHGIGQVTITTTNKSFFDYFVSSGIQLDVGQTYAEGSEHFIAIIDGLNGWGDAFMRTVKYYTPSDGHLSEEYNRNTGEPQGCVDLTWSYASILTAAIQRASLRGESTYLEDLANVGFAANS